MAAPRTNCPVTREQFRQGAKPLTIQIGDLQLTAEPREFSSMSLGWNVSDKITLEVGGVRVKCQLGLNLTVVGSKDAE